MKPDAQYALLLESIAEINARLRVLDDANARLEATAERQLELLEILMTRQAQILALLRDSSPEIPNESPTRQAHTPQQDFSRTESGPERARIIDNHHEYSRETHPALFRVVDLLEQDERARKLSVRQLAQETGVGKSWCAMAKRHVLRGKSVH